jgi:hypothetical protein
VGLFFLHTAGASSSDVVVPSSRCPVQLAQVPTITYPPGDGTTAARLNAGDDLVVGVDRVDGAEAYEWELFQEGTRIAHVEQPATRSDFWGVYWRWVAVSGAANGRALAGQPVPFPIATTAWYTIERGGATGPRIEPGEMVISVRVLACGERTNASSISVLVGCPDRFTVAAASDLAARACSAGPERPALSSVSGR